MRATSSLRTAAAAVPVLLLMALAATGIASAIQTDEADAIDVGPQPGDYLDAAGESDIAGYLVGTAVFRSAPAIPIGEELELRVFGCTEGEAIAVDLIPRILNAAETEAQADAGLLEGPLNLVDEAEALADGSVYALELPATTPVGFVRFRVDCVGESEQLQNDTVANAVVRADFEAAQEDAEEPAELVTTLDAGDTPEAQPISGT